MLTQEQLAKLRGTAKKVATTVATAVTMGVTNPTAAKEFIKDEITNAAQNTIENIVDKASDKMKDTVADATTVTDNEETGKSYTVNEQSPQHRNAFKDTRDFVDGLVAEHTEKEEIAQSGSTKISISNQAIEMYGAEGVMDTAYNFDNGDISVAIGDKKVQLSKNGNCTISEAESYTDGAQSQHVADRSTWSFRGMEDGKIIGQVITEHGSVPVSSEDNTGVYDSAKTIGYAYIENGQLKSLSDYIAFIDNYVPQASYTEEKSSNYSADNNGEVAITEIKKYEGEGQETYSRLSKEFKEANAGNSVLANEYNEICSKSSISKVNKSNITEQLKALRGLSGQTKSSNKSDGGLTYVITQQDMLNMAKSQNKQR